LPLVELYEYVKLVIFALPGADNEIEPEVIGKYVIAEALAPTDKVSLVPTKCSVVP
jgi:hypothetical protein